MVVPPGIQVGLSPTLRNRECPWVEMVTIKVVVQGVWILRWPILVVNKMDPPMRKIRDTLMLSEPGPGYDLFVRAG